jgi:hypothetical protein
MRSSRQHVYDVHRVAIAEAPPSSLVELLMLRVGRDQEPSAPPTDACICVPDVDPA